MPDDAALDPVRMEPHSTHLRASAPGYAARFEAGGVAFEVPGVDAELTFRLETIHLGEELLHRATGLTAATDQGNVADYRHTPAVAERYEARAEGIEQTFVFETLPQGGGDLVVRGRLESDLQLVSSDPQSGLVYEHPQGFLNYGGVTGVDAAGERAQGWILLQGETLELGLPAEFVQRAQLPLVLDPLIGPNQRLGGGIPRARAKELDVASFPDGTGLVVWSGFEGSGCNPRCVEYSRLFGQYIRPSGAPDGNAFVISTSFDAYSPDPPAVAVLQTDDGPRFVVAYESLGVSVSLLAPGLPVRSIDVATSPGGEQSVDVSSGRDRCTVVWHKDGVGIEGADLGMNLVTGQPIVFQSYRISQDQLDSRPSIARDEAAGDTTFVTWHRDPFGTGRIMGRAWSGPFFGFGPPEFEVARNTLKSGRPRVAASHPDDFLVVWSQQAPGTLIQPRIDDIKGRRVSFRSQVGVDPVTGPVLDIESTPGETETQPTVDYIGNAYAVFWLDENGPNWGFYGRILDSMNGHTLEILTPVSSEPILGHAVAPRDTNEWGLESDRLISVWSKNSSEQFNPAHVFARPATGREGGFAPVIDTGCDLLGGDPRVSTVVAGNTGFRMELWYGEPDVAAYFIVSDVANIRRWGDAFFVPRLRNSARGFMGRTDQDGYVGLDIELPAHLAGVELWGQFAVLSGGASQQCTNRIWNLSDGFRLDPQ